MLSLFVKRHGDERIGIFVNDQLCGTFATYAAAYASQHEVLENFADVRIEVHTVMWDASLGKWRRP